MKKTLSILLAFSFLFSCITVSAKDINVSFTETELGSWTVTGDSSWDGSAIADNGFIKLTRLNPTSNGAALKPNISMKYNPGTTLVKGAKYTVTYDYIGENITGGQQLLFNVGSNKISVSFKSNKEEYTNSVNGVSEFGYKNESFWGTHNADYTFEVTDIKDADGKELKSVRTSNMYIKVNTNGRNDAVNYDGVCFKLGNFSITETLPEGYNPSGDDEEIRDPTYSTVTTIVNENFDGENPLANWSNVVSGSGTRTVEDGAVCVAPADANSRIRYEKVFNIKRGAEYTVSYKVKASKTTSWLFGIEASDKFYGTSSAMYDNSIRNIGAMSTQWQQVSYTFKAASDMETPSTKTIAVFFLFTTAAEKVWIDDFKIVETIYPEFPEITSAAVRGASMANGNVSADCTIKDTDNVLKDITYTWQLSSDGEDWKDVSSEKNYKIPFDSVGKFIRFKAKVSSKATNKKGKEFITEAKTIASERTVPALSDLKLKVSGEKYAVSYNYESEYDKGESVVLWQYSKDKENWNTIEGTNGETFIANGIGAGQYVRACVIPVDVDGVEGKAYYTDGEDTLPDFISFYVATDGNDKNDGTIDAPFATLEAARSRVRTLISNGDAGNCDITVYIRGGEYYRTSAFTLTSEDSGSADHPISYVSYNGEKVTFTGGKTVPEDEIVKVTDEDILSRIIDDTAKSKLLSVDLSKYYMDIPEIPDYSHQNDAIGNGQTIFRKQVRPVVNGQPLKRAQWPNEDEDEIKITAVSDDATEVTLEKDISAHASAWKSNRIHAVGHMTSSATWTYQDYKITDAEGSKFTLPAKDNYKPMVNGLLRFYDILEEIDCPGESYIDIDTKMLYFYPYGDEKPEVVLPVSEGSLLSVNGANNINIKGIDFECVRNQAFALYNDPENVTIEGCSFKHFNAMNSIAGKNNTIKDCFAYDGAVGFISVNGGDPRTVTKGNNVIENCVMRENSAMKRAYGHTILLSGFGNTVKNCDISGADGDLIGGNGMGHRITGCKIYDGTRWTGDMGTLYFGKSAVSIGSEIDHNFFYNHASSFADGWAQAIFFDDGGICANIHDNVFYKATLATSEGGQNFSIKTHGGQYMKIENNIFIDNPYAVQFQTWTTSAEMKDYSAKPWQEIRWFLLLFDKYTTSFGWKDQLISNGVIDENYNVSDAWKNYCKGTQWEAYLELFECGFYDEVKNLDPKNEEQYEQIKKIAGKYAPNYTNSFTNNAVFEGLNAATGVHDWSKAIDKDNYVSKSVKGIFENYGTDFKLTSDGLEKIKKSAPEFKDIAFDEIGAVSLTDGGNPSASSAYITDMEGTVTLSYTYEGKVNEGFSQVDWYVSDTENGKFEKVLGKHDTILPGDYIGKYVYAEVVPVSGNGAEGEVIKTEIVKVSSDITIDTLLKALIEESEKIESAVGMGEGYAAATENSHNTLKSAIAAAKAAKTDSEKYEQYDKLGAALEGFKNSVNKLSKDLENGKTYTIMPFMDEQNIEVSEMGEGIALRFPTNCELAAVTVKGFVTVDGKKCAAELVMSDETVISSDDEFVTINIFGDSSSAAVTPANADTEKLTAVKLTEGSVRVSKPVSFEILGVAKTKQLGYVENGKFLNITKSASVLSDIKENSKLAVKDGVGFGLVKLSELVIYSKAAISDDDGEIGGSGGTMSGTNSGSSYGGTSGGSSSNAFYSGETTSPNLTTEFCFDDVKDHWAKAFIMKMYSAGIVSGVSERTFEPDRAITRAEFAALIARTLKLSADSKTEFSDVDEGTWYADEVNACAKNGIISGYEGTFRPDDTITRYEMAVVISNAYAHIGGEIKNGGIDKFRDKDMMPNWAKNAVDVCVSVGIISGMEEDVFGGEGVTTRAQAAVVLSKLSAK